jgi:hypothetical protein
LNKKKLGRNDKCNCGSGKKYKKCCLNKVKLTDNSPQNIIQLHQYIVFKYFEENHLALESEKKTFKSQIFDSISDFELSSIEILKNNLLECEKLISEIASTHNTYDLLFWSRRLAPKNIFNVAESSVILYKEIQALAIYKYGKSNENVYADKNIGTIPINLKEYFLLDSSSSIKKINSEKLPTSISNLLTDVIRIEILSYIFLDLTQLYRIASKGAEIHFKKATKNITFSMSKDLDYLINLYDERLSKANLFSITGAFLNDSTNKSSNKSFCPAFQINVDNKTKFPIFNPQNQAYKNILPDKDDIIEFTPNYILGAIKLKNIYDFLELFSKEFKEKYNFSIEDFIVFLGFLGNNVVGNIMDSFEFQLHIFNRAYSTLEYDLDSLELEFLENYKSIYENILDKKISETEFKKINPRILLEKFILLKENKNDIDLWTRGPKKILYQLSDSQMIFDYTGLADIISYVTKELTMVDGETGNKRAITFEEELIKELENNFNKEHIWVCQKEIESREGKKEIDGSFVIDDVLFLLEAKAVNVSFGYDKGDKKALDFRMNKMKSAIKELKSKCAFIKENKNSIVPNIPDKIKYLCPIVISSYPEYIWEKSENLFISTEKNLPRILTINDIQILKELDIKELKKQKWLVSL